MRERPSLDAPVVGKCKAGTAVTIDQRRSGFVHLTSPQGCASAEFVKATTASGQPSSAARAPQANTRPSGAPAARRPSGAPAQAPAAGQPGPSEEQKSLADLAPGLLR